MPLAFIAYQNDDYIKSSKNNENSIQWIGNITTQSGWVFKAILNDLCCNEDTVQHSNL